MYDIASIKLKLKPQHNNCVPWWLGRAAQALFLASLRRVHPKLSTQIHDGDGIKPFTSSNLVGSSSGANVIDIHPSQTLWLRFTTLHPDLTAIALNGLVPMWYVEGIRLHDQPFRVLDVQTQDTQSPWAGTMQYKNMLTSMQKTPRAVTITFASPTAFKDTKAGRYVPYPLPELVFGSLLDRWNAHTSQPLSPDLRQFALEHAAMQHLDVRSKTISFSRSRHSAVTGFVGSVTYRLNGDEALCRQLAVLGQFAKFSGIGVRTTIGLGQAKAA